MDAYTYVPKPISSTYGFANPQGKQFYNQSDIAYDDANVFYDSINDTSYTYIPKPSGPGFTSGGATQGLLMPLTRSASVRGADSYTYIAKPTS